MTDPAPAQEMRRFRRNGAEEPILTRHFGYDIQMRIVLMISLKQPRPATAHPKHDHPSHRDLPDLSRYTGAVDDMQTMGLSLSRDRLCLVQLSPGDGSADVVQIPPHARDAPNLKLLADAGVLKIFHFARFDLAMLYNAFGVMPEPVYCTKIASRLSRTYTDKHGLKDLVREVLGQEISKQQQSSDWGAPDLTDAQISYAAADVLYLPALKERLDTMLAREGREKLAAACFRFLPDRVRLDIAGFADEDIFAHS